MYSIALDTVGHQAAGCIGLFSVRRHKTDFTILGCQVRILQDFFNRYIQFPLIIRPLFLPLRNPAHMVSLGRFVKYQRGL